MDGSFIALKADEVIEEVAEPVVEEVAEVIEARRPEDMSHEALRSLVLEAVKEALAPLIGQLKTQEKLESMIKALGEEVKAQGTTSKTTKTSIDAQVEALQTEMEQKFKALFDGQPTNVLSTVAVNAQLPEALDPMQPTVKASVSAADRIGGWLKSAE